MNKLNEIQITSILKLSQKLTQKEIAQKYNVSQMTISKILRKNNINTSRSRLNESKLKFNISYFDKIDTEKKAYWLGYIAADGCLKNNKVSIVSKDKSTIIKFKNDLQSEHKLCTNNVFDKRTNKTYTNYTISITNILFTKKIQKYINIDKSNHFVIPNINKKYYSSFIAGMFDGDGSISIDHNNKIRISLISTYECLLQIQNILLQENIKKINIHKHSKTLNLYKFHLYTNEATKFLKYIYNVKYTEMYLSRKFKIFESYDIKNNVSRFEHIISLSEILERQKRGLSNYQIAEDLGIAYCTLMRKIRKYKRDKI